MRTKLLGTLVGARDTGRHRVGRVQTRRHNPSSSCYNWPGHNDSPAGSGGRRRNAVDQRADKVEDMISLDGIAQLEALLGRVDEADVRLHGHVGAEHDRLVGNVLGRHNDVLFYLFDVWVQHVRLADPGRVNNPEISASQVGDADINKGCLVRQAHEPARGWQSRH